MMLYVEEQRTEALLFQKSFFFGRWVKKKKKKKKIKTKQRTEECGLSWLISCDVPVSTTFTHYQFAFYLRKYKTRGKYYLLEL